MGKRVLAAFGVVAPMNVVLASGLSAAPTSAIAATSSTAERTGRGLSTLTLRRKSPWGAWPQTGVPQERSVPGRRQAVPEPAALQGRAGARNRHLERPHGRRPARRKGGFDHTAMNPLGLGQFMSDRGALDRYKARLSLYVGEVHGPNPADPTSSASTRSTSRAPKAEPLLDTGCPPRPGSRRTPRREAISPTVTLHPRKHA
ncbi:hypothetical protein [Streptomyces sp. NPDC017435]|uniref:hypothetical protein n=1 Tax=Streptomyces sp. NPDC017435 TaxID=3364995 RepID=UPI00379B086E